MHLLQNDPNAARWSQRRLTRFGWVCFLPALLALAPLSFSADATNANQAPPAELETNNVADVMRAYVQLQEQLHATQLALERNRQEAAAAATRNAETFATRLLALEEALGTQRAQEIGARAQELEAIRGANRLMVTIGGVFVVVAFLAMMLTAYFQWRAVSRLTEFSALSQTSLTMGRGALPAPATYDAHPLAGALPEQVNTRLLGALEQLEKRILELEQTARTPLGESAFAATGVAGGKTDRISLLLAKGESLLGLDKTDEALACFDEILALEPQHTEALVKKGDALERLRMIDDAIGCYDRAITADGSLTVAYLHKGGLFNRLERYEEALQCYEQALRTQEKSHTVQIVPAVESLSG